jgi:hypothetical protein
MHWVCRRATDRPALRAHSPRPAPFLLAAVLMGQRAVPVVRLVVGVAMDQLKPAVLAGGAHVGPAGGVALALPPMPTWAMTAVIVGWIIGWLAIGAWKMATRDA